MDSIETAFMAGLPDPRVLLAEQEWLRVLARALVGESDADDLSQEVVVAALERRPEPREGLRPWLARVARRLALQRLRRLLRRERRERAAARDEAQPSAADVVERAQLHGAVVDAVLALAEPYRTTLLLRFFDGLSVPDVAQRCGLPLETARTRLRRGLALLRARLYRSCGGRASWAVALARMPVAASGSTALSGGLIMSTLTKTLLGGAAALAAGLLIWSLIPVPPPVAPQAGSMSSAVAALQHEWQPPLQREGQPPETAPATEGQRRIALEQPAIPAGNTVVLRGRCVAAEGGAALTGCRVDLWQAAPDAEGSTGGGPAASAVTAAGGDFRVEWPLSEPRRITLVFRAEQRGHERRVWPRVTRGEIDCGDVPLTLGATLAGRAVDERGLPVAGVRLGLTLEPDDAKPAPPDGRPIVSASSGSDGTLRAVGVLTPGRWKPLVWSEHQLVAPSELLVTPGMPVIVTDVVVRRPEELPAITGVAVDQSGRPVPRLMIYAAGRHGPENSGTSAADGSFVLRRKIGSDDSVRLQVMGAHRLREPMSSLEWGARDVRLVVLCPATARLIVVDSAGARVEHFAVRLSAVDGSETRRLPAAQVQLRTRDGALVLRDLPPNRYRVVAQPEDRSRGCSPPLEWDLHDGALLRVELRAPAELRVTLQLADGAPVGGSRVQLLRGEGGVPLRLDCTSVPLADTFVRGVSGPTDGIVLDEATTGADGDAVLHGPSAGGTALAVRALGPGHAPLLQPDVVLAPGNNRLALRVARGATVSGTLGPRAVLDELRPQAKDLAAAAGPGGNLARWTAARAPVLQLNEAGGAHRRLPLNDVNDGYGLPLPPDGEFRFEGVPAGDWRLTLHYWVGVGRGGGGTKREHELAIVAGLRDGEVRRLDPDVSALRPGRIAGLVLSEGEPWRRGRVRLETMELRTDAEGRFTVQLDAGSYRLALLPGDDTPLFDPSAVHADQPVAVAPGATVEHTFDVRRRVLRLRVLEADGTPADRRLILLRGGTSRDGAQPDAEGWILVDPAPPEPIEVLTFPKGFDAAARAAASPDMRWRQVIRLGPVTLPVGQREASVELRIPADR